MKKITTPDQPDLSKEIIANLTDEQLREVEGGIAPAGQISCWGTTCHGNQTITREQE